MVSLVAGISTHELDGGKTTASQEPAPKVVEEKAEAQERVESNEEAHKFVVLLVDVMIPNTNNRDDHVAGTYP